MVGIDTSQLVSDGSSLAFAVANQRLSPWPTITILPTIRKLLFLQIFSSSTLLPVTNLRCYHSWV